MSGEFQWGGAGWSEIGWSDSDEAFAHSLRTVVGINSQATAKRLGHPHHLETIVTIGSDALSIGYGPKAIHPLATLVEIDADVLPVPLTFTHILETTIAIDSDAWASLTIGHTLDTEIIIAGASSGYLTLRHHLVTVLAIETAASASHLTLSHPLATIVEILSAAEAAEIISAPSALIPDVLAPLTPSALVAGVVNLIRNPSAELSLEGWTAYGGASIEPDPDYVWQGDQSVKVTAGIGQGVAVRTALALRLQPWGGSVLWGQIRVASDDEGVTVAAWLQATYADGTVNDANATTLEVTGSGATAEDWDLIVTPPLALDATKQLASARIVVQDLSAVGSDVYFVDGASIEYDEMMHGPSAVVVVDDTALKPAA